MWVLLESRKRYHVAWSCRHRGYELTNRYAGNKIQVPCKNGKHHYLIGPYLQPSDNLTSLLLIHFEFILIPISPRPRPEKDGSATGVNMICTHRSEPTDMGLDPKQLYWELSRETHGITQLDFITLDKNSLYVNGECVSSCRYLPQGVHCTF